MKLALFDLDRTLLPIDSADTWSHFLVQEGGLDAEDSVFYSDSITDLPLPERVKRPVATNPEPRLRAVAAARGWPTLELFACADR